MKKKMDVEFRGTVDPARNRYPYCIVWTPLPIITWIFPFIGHMGICTSAGVIRDFAGPYYVSEDEMGFGNPTMYWQMSPSTAELSSWDSAVHQASEEYSKRMHNLFCDNCHSHVARALNLMQYNKSTSWNMYKLGFLMVIKGKFVGVSGFLKTWLPFIVLCILVLIVVTIATVVSKTTT
ncbi:transmembrane protein 222-like [Gigantopelta aegis]|uniref:transmembrane protein 222-like n=1 Tax=Gigantopelta aegis TaxID=1735272 RepID=UPI001B88D3A3|nr:transmembrane protein 222-like [Gigantopelta aegis]